MKQDEDSIKLMFNSLMNAQGVGLIFIDAEGVIVECNLFFAQLIECTQDELINRSFFSYIEKKQKDSFLMALQQLASSEYASVQNEIHFITNKGKQYYANVSITVLTNQKNKPNGYSLIVSNAEQYDNDKNANDLNTQVNEFEFSEIFNLHEIQEIQDAIANVTGVASIITKPNGDPITKPSNFCRLCNEIVRPSEVGGVNCCLSDSKIGISIDDRPTVQPCLSAGLYDAGSSIKIGNHIIAKWLVGQVLTEKTNIEDLITYADKIGIDKGFYKAALEEVNFMPISQLEKIAKLTFLISNILSKLAFQNRKQMKFIAKMSEAGEALRESEKRFRNAITQAPIPIIIHAENGEVLALSNSWTEITGYTLDIIPTISHWLSYAYGDRKTQLEKNIDSLFKISERIDEGEFVITTLLGDKRYWDFSSAPLGVLSDGRKMIISMAKDITDRKEAELLLHEEQMRQEIIINSSPITIWFKDINNKIIKVNKAASLLVGLNINEIEGLSSSCFFITDVDEFCIDDAINPQIGISQILKDSMGNIHHMKTDRFPWFDKNENLAGCIAYSIDVTEQLNAEKQIFERNNLLKSILESSPDVCAYALDINFNFLAFNSLYKYFVKSIFNIELELGMNLYIDILKKNAPEIDRYSILNEILKGKTLSLNSSTEDESMGVIYWRNCFSPIYSNNIVTGITCFSLNITEQMRDQQLLEESQELLKIQNDEYIEANNELLLANKQIIETSEALMLAKEKAEESDKLKSAFLANMSHEIRTPMNAIKGFSQLLETPDLSPSKIAKYTRIINQRTDDLLMLINDLLDISKIEAGQLVIQEGNSNINTLFTEIYDFFKANIDFNEHENLVLKYINELTDNQSELTTDFFRLRQILINIINNAIKFTKEGYVYFGCKLLDNNNLLFYVEDTGIGISPEFASIVFERFRQANDSKYTKEYSGTGLGLSIVKGILELMDGKIWFESEVGKGTTFYFTIPYRPYNQASMPASIPSDKDYNWEGKHILIVEDDTYNGELIKEFLLFTKANYTLITNGLDAIIAYQKNQKFDVVLMDVQLPDIDGYEVTKQIVKINPQAIVIAQTAYAAQTDKMRAIECGCKDYISKPINRHKLLKLLDTYL